MIICPIREGARLSPEPSFGGDRSHKTLGKMEGSWCLQGADVAEEETVRMLNRGTRGKSHAFQQP